MRYYAIKESSSATPSSWKWNHERRDVAVLEVVSPDHEPAMISNRARGVVRIIRCWGCCYVGRSVRDQYTRAYTEAEALVERLRHEALIAQAVRFGGTVDGDTVIIETMEGSERLPLAALVEARATAQAEADAARLALSRAQSDAADAAASFAIARSAS